MITYKFRLYPTKQQQTKLWEHSITLNSLYNYFLEQRINAYENKLEPVYRKHQQAELVKLKKEKPELKAIHSQVLQQVPFRLDKAYQVFFKRNKEGQGKPHFRSSKNFFSLVYPQSGYKLSEKTVYFGAYGSIKLLQHRTIVGKVKQVTIANQNGMWFLCVTTDYTRVVDTTRKIIGVDLGVTNLVATSDGKLIKNKGHAKYFDKQINHIKSHRDKKCKKYSRRYKRLSKVVKRLYGVKNRKVNDFLHKVSKQLTQNYDTIVIEDLSVNKMSESKATGLNREIRNACLSRFVNFLEYKAKRLIKVNPAYTSQRCNSCGELHKMPLHKRSLKCSCGYVEDRDINAAKNIYCLGQAYLLSQGLVASITDLHVGSPSL